MHIRFWRFFDVRRRLAAAVLVLGVVGVTACSRKDAILDPSVTPPQPGGLVTYRNTVAHLLSDRSTSATPVGCTYCHHAGSEIPDWSNYQNVFANRDLIKFYLSNPTFPDMQQFMKDSTERQTVIDWVDAGAPE